VRREQVIKAQDLGRDGVDECAVQIERHGLHILFAHWTDARDATFNAIGDSCHPLIPVVAASQADRQLLLRIVRRLPVCAQLSDAAESDGQLTEEMLARATIKKGGRPISANPRKQVTIRLPADVLARWKSTGPGWQTRMAERLSKAR
jgi:uncharacterized protein (DUF4415 family)